MMERIVVTEKEKIRETLFRAKQSVEAEDIEIINLIDPSFRYQNFGFEDLKENIINFYNRFDRIKIDLDLKWIVLVETSATCSGLARVTAWTDSMPVLIFGKILSRSPIRIELNKRDGRWLIRGIDAH